MREREFFLILRRTFFTSHSLPKRAKVQWPKKPYSTITECHSLGCFTHTPPVYKPIFAFYYGTMSRYCCLWWKVDRYKYVVVVNIGPTTNNELIIASRCLLNPVSDTFASYTFDERGLYAVAVVYAFYREWNSHRQSASCHTVQKSASISDKCFMQMALLCVLYKFPLAARQNRAINRHQFPGVIFRRRSVVCVTSALDRKTCSELLWSEFTFLWLRLQHRTNGMIGICLTI